MTGRIAYVREKRKGKLAVGQNSLTYGNAVRQEARALVYREALSEREAVENVTARTAPLGEKTNTVHLIASDCSPTVGTVFGCLDTPAGTKRPPYPVSERLSWTLPPLKQPGILQDIPLSHFISHNSRTVIENAERHF